MLDGGDFIQDPMPCPDADADPTVKCPEEYMPPPPVIVCRYSDDDSDDELFEPRRRRRWNRSLAGDEEAAIRFSPPVYLQRYFRCLDIVAEYQKRLGNIRTVVDFGCAEGKFLQRARFSLPNSVTRLIGVDLDEELLWKSALRPLRSLNDLGRGYFLDRRQVPLRVQLFAGRIGWCEGCIVGSVTEFDDRLTDVDAVIAIELIEHLPEGQISAFPEAIFGRLRPRLVVLTTPNSDFNPLFKMAPGTFRHPDHKFEWTQAEFEAWCTKVVEQYDDYTVRFDGVGKLLPDRLTVKRQCSESKDSECQPELDLGFCSQIAVFECRDYEKLKNVKADGAISAIGLSRPYRKILDHTYLCDATGNRRSQTQIEMIRICELLYTADPSKYLKEAYKKRGQRVVLPLDEVFDRLDARLQMFCLDKYDAAQLLLERNRDWETTVDAQPYIPKDGAGFGNADEEAINAYAAEQLRRGFPPKGYIHMPITFYESDSPSSSSSKRSSGENSPSGFDEALPGAGFALLPEQSANKASKLPEQSASKTPWVFGDGWKASW